MVDIGSLVVANLYFALRIAPLVVIAVGVLRGILLFSGQKREFEGWTRNLLLSVLSIIFLPGTLVFVAIRLAMCKIFRIDISNVGGSSTYGEINIFLRVNSSKPPRVVAVLASLFTTVVLSVFVSLTLLAVPAILLINDPQLVLLCSYVAVGVLFNTSIRSGDLALIHEALRKRPRSGAIELVAVIVSLAIFYSQLLGVVM